MDELFRQIDQLNEILAEKIIKQPHTIIPLPPLSVASLNKYRDMRVIFNNPATILIIGGKKYVSKAHDEEFDEEKGLLMCLAKASGITHTRLKALIKNADRPKTARN